MPRTIEAVNAQVVGTGADVRIAGHLTRMRDPMLQLAQRLLTNATGLGFVHNGL